MSELTSLPNIGKVLEQQLKEVGITSAEELRAVGSEEAWVRILAIDSSACYNRLCGLEGAVQGIRWHDLDPQVKTELKQFYRQKKTLGAYPHHS